MTDVKLLKNQVKKEIDSARDLKELEQVFRKYLGKKGQIVLLLKGLKDIPKEKRAKVGKELNLVKKFVEQEIELKSKKIRLLGVPTEEVEWIDITIPGKRPTIGHLHPLTLTKRKVEEIFQSMGFSVVDGPEIETEWYNFDALNIPKYHPARDMWDTFWLKGNQKLLMRTHTSPVQIRYMEKNKPPLRIIVPGRVFRHEATDACHEFDLNHIEGLMVDKDVSIANFRAVIEEFLRRFFNREIQIRMRPSYFPFTEPSFEVDISCANCAGRGCSVCSGRGWLEMMGAGMVHPFVFKSAGLDPKEWQGFAFGIGMDRLAMMKYKINDIRLFHSGDLRFINQF
jgi:phenylalanyl-tRNA synthetase alpha chain